MAKALPISWQRHFQFYGRGTSNFMAKALPISWQRHFQFHGKGTSNFMAKALPISWQRHVPLPSHQSLQDIKYTLPFHLGMAKGME